MISFSVKRVNIYIETCTQRYREKQFLFKNIFRILTVIISKNIISEHWEYGRFLISYFSLNLLCKCSVLLLQWEKKTAIPFNKN